MARKQTDTSEKFNILIVEDHPVVRRGYVALVTREPDLEVCGEAVSAQEALAYLEEGAPDAVVLDVALPGDMNGIDLLRRLQQQYPDLPVLVVSGNEAAVYGDQVMAQGAWGYVMKGDAAAFMQAVRSMVSEMIAGSS